MFKVYKNLISNNSVKLEATFSRGIIPTGGYSDNFYSLGIFLKCISTLGLNTDYSLTLRDDVSIFHNIENV